MADHLEVGVAVGAGRAQRVAVQRIIAFDVRQGSLGEQLETIRLIGQSLRGKALVVDTVFNAWNTLKRNVLKEAMGPLMEEHPAEL